MNWHWPGFAYFRRRLLFRGAFALLAIATVALALNVLVDERQLSLRNYRDGFGKTAAQIAAKLHHPSGQLALINPALDAGRVTPLHPLVLPYSGIDFDDRAKVQQAVEMAGCQVQYPDQASLCVAVGNKAWAGAFVYVTGSFNAGALQPRERGELDVSQAHRVRVSVASHGSTQQWIAPYELDERGRGRLTGFVDADGLLPATRPQKDFRGWLWQGGPCIGANDAEGCRKRTFFSVRLTLDALREAPTWPPGDLDQLEVHVQVLPPGDGAPLLDSDAAGATPPFSLADLKPLLLPGETLHIRKGTTEVATLVGSDTNAAPAARWMVRLLRRLPADDDTAPIEAHDSIATPLGRYDIALTGDVRGVERTLAAVAGRLSWFVGAMLLAILGAWLIIEIGLIRRIAVLTRRARSVSKEVRADERMPQLDVSDLRGPDELGILATTLNDLLQRVKEDVQREHIRAEQEKNQWHAVGHEIMAPLQSLMALHGSADDASARYINRMQQAVRVLYGRASPSEAFQSTSLQLQPLDLHAFLRNVADNAPHAGIADVAFESAEDPPLMVRADEYSLEDVITHVLRNADRYRVPGTRIRMVLDRSDTQALLDIHNVGPAIDTAMLDKIFEYGVSDAQDGAQRGQGLFVAKTYMAKMGGTITARNADDGVSFVLALPRVS